jgi:transcription elongation GreA/GreB family factor
LGFSESVSPSISQATQLHKVWVLVIILQSDGRQQTYRIVGEDEADPLRASISHVSAVTRALVGNEVESTR